MFALEHKVRVFVFQILEREIQFLLLRHKPAEEWPLGPVIGPVGHGEHIRDAIVREVRAETGIAKPLHIMDFSQPTKELFGDIGLVEWPFGYQAGTRGAAELVPGPQIEELGWMGFEEAFRCLEASGDREHLVRLHLELEGG